MSSADSKSKRKSDNISPITIIASIEREIQNLLLEITIRSQKDSLTSILESLKMLSRKIEADYVTNTEYSLMKPSGNTSKIENTTVKNEEKEDSNSKEEMNKLKEEIEELKKMNNLYKESNVESQLKVYMEEKENMLNSIKNNEQLEGKV